MRTPLGALPHRRGPHSSGRTRRLLALTAAACLLAAAGCTVPPPTGGLPACPAHKLVVIEDPDPVHFSIPRGVSANGAWTISSRVIGADLQFSIAPAAAGATRQVVGTIPTSVFTWAPPYAAVSSDGSIALFGERNEVLMRWRSSTGTAAAVPEPTVASPPPGLPQTTYFTDLSSDGARAVWQQSFYEAPSTWHQVRTVTDTSTDAVISQEETQPDDDPYMVSPGGHFLTTGDELVEIDTGIRTPFAPAVAQLATDFPGAVFWPLDSSDNGRFTVFARNDGGNPAQSTYVLWDSAATTSALVVSGTDLRWTAGIAEDGRLVYLRYDGTTTTVIERAPDGSETTIVSAPLLETWSTLDAYRPVKQDRVATSANLKTVLSSEIIAFSNYRLQAHRCT